MLFTDADTFTDTDTDDRNSPSVFQLVLFYPDTDVRILIRRRGLTYCLFF